MFARLTTTLLIGSLALAFAAPASAAVDADAAKALAKKNDCFKCHAIDKTKKGPSYKKISAKYREPDKKAGAEEKMMKHLTTSPKVKLEDGTEEDHKAMDGVSKPELTNLIQWILSN